MQKVGLTGGIGSGKTTVAKVFEILGIPIYYADKEAKRLMHENNRLKVQIQETFGQHVYRNDVLDRKALAAIVFENPKALQKLNSLVHPVVRSDFAIWAACQNVPYVIEESAILLETGLSEDFDCIVSVLAPMQERLNRLQQRDGATVEQIELRMNAQVDDAVRREKSDYLLQNGKDDLLLPQIMALDKALRKKNN